MNLYSPLIYSWCRRSGLQPADVDAVGQEVFAAVAAKLKDFRHGGEHDTFRGWLRVITRNKIRTCQSQMARRERLLGGCEDVAASSGWWEDDAEETRREETRLLYHSALQQMRQEFRDRDWEAFYRTVGREESPGDVAFQLGMSVNAVYLAKSRILKRLRERFAAYIEEPRPGGRKI